MPKETMKIPIDPRYPEGCAAYPRPQVTSAMKMDCIGEFTIEREQTCPSCYAEEEGPQADCTICSGNLTYTEKIDVPWDIMKDIYKRMATAAAREVEQ